MHLEEGILQTYLDQQLSPKDHHDVHAHLTTCEQCCSMLENITNRQKFVTTKLSATDPTIKQSAITANTAYLRLMDRVKDQKLENKTMWQKLTRKSMRPVWVVFAVLVLVAGLMFVPQVRAAAVNFLGLFRVENITVVQFNPANLPQDLDSRMMKLEDMLQDQFVLPESIEPVEAADLNEASTLAGFSVLDSTSFKGAKRYTFQPGGKAELTINVALMQMVLNELGSDFVIPKEIDGQKVTVEIPGSVTTLMGLCPKFDSNMDLSYGASNCTSLVQMPSPIIDTPPGLDAQEVGIAMLQLLGLSADEAVKISADIDWASTLVIPIPQNVEYQTVDINGTKGTLFIEDVNPTRNVRYSLIWTKDGKLYALSGRGTPRGIIQLAESLE